MCKVFTAQLVSNSTSNSCLVDGDSMHHACDQAVSMYNVCSFAHRQTLKRESECCAPRAPPCRGLSIDHAQCLQR